MSVLRKHMNLLTHDEVDKSSLSAGCLVERACGLAGPGGCVASLGCCSRSISLVPSHGSGGLSRIAVD